MEPPQVRAGHPRRHPLRVGRNQNQSGRSLDTLLAYPARGEQLSTKRMWLLNTGTSTFLWWLRLIVAAFLLSAWVAVGLGSGIAHADDPAPSGSKSSSESSTGTPKTKKADAKTEPSPSENKPPADDTTTDTKPPTVDQPSDPAPEANAEPDDPPKPSARRGSHRPGLTIASAKPAKPNATEPKPSASTATTYRSAAASGQEPPKQAARQLAAVANVGPSVSSPQTTAPPVHLPNQDQIVGVVTDVGVVAASVVYTVADTVAQRLRTAQPSSARHMHLPARWRIRLRPLAEH